MSDNESSSDEVFYRKSSVQSFQYGEPEPTFEGVEDIPVFQYGENDDNETLPQSQSNTVGEKTPVFSESVCRRPVALDAELTPFSHRFVRDFQKLFPHPEEADWSGCFSWARGLPGDSDFAAAERTSIIGDLFGLFANSAKDFAVQLIDESFRPEIERTISPTNRFGGVAGGKKFCHSSISTQLFKFAEDVELKNGRFLYGGKERNDRLAQKAAGHELKSTQALLDSGVPEIHFPLMAIITHRGKRVTCSSVIPLDKLVQGQADVAKGLVLPNSTVAAVMAALGGALNVHSEPLGIFGPFDLEIHSGKDGKLYALDTARLMPPQNPRGPRRHLVELLRPELLRRLPAPLASDAFFPAIANRFNVKHLQKDIVDATEQVLSEARAIGTEILSGKTVF